MRLGHVHTTRPSCSSTTHVLPRQTSRRGHIGSSSSNRAPCRPSSLQQQPAAPASDRSLGTVSALPPSAPVYNSDVSVNEWALRPVPVAARLLEIAAAFGSWWVKSRWHRDPQRAAADMREVLVELGPAFVKIGQALSSRPDVLPPEYIAELELLQDRIPPFSNDEALQVIEQELGLPWTQVFSSLSPCPVAAASLGQVYRGRLVSSNAEVAVKVQRPGVVEAIGRDTYILRNLAAIARKQAKLNTDLPALVDEWASSLFKELDYTREAANAIRFAKLFSFMPEVVVPKMFTEWTTPRVLVMEWIEGERLRSASKQALVTPPAAAAAGSGGGAAAQASLRQQQQRSSPDQVAEDLRLVEIGVRCSLEQMLEEGFYHADPHPGNLLKVEGGKLAYIDFGMMGSIEPSVRQALIRATLHLVNREYELLAEDFVALGLLPRGSNMDEVIPALTGVFQTALAGGVSNISFSTLSADLGRTMYRYSFRLPPYYTLLVRSLSVLEGIALASDPNYKVLGAAYPWVSRRLLLTTSSSELTATLDNLLYDSKGRFNFDRLESLLEQAAKARVEAGGAAARPSSAAAGSSRQGPAGSGADGGLTLRQQQRQEQGLLASVASAVGGALAGPEGSELLLSSLQLLSNSSGGGAWQQQVSGRGSAAAAAGGPLALVLSPEGRHIRGILEDELAKGLDAAWRLNLDRTLDAASVQLESALSLAASTPLGSSLVPQWLQQQVRAAAGSSHSSSEERSSSSGSSGSSSAAGSGSDGQPDLIENLLSLPRLSGEDDRVQIDGLQRLAVQLAAFSAPVSSSAAGPSAQQQHQQQQTPQQEANAAALQQVRQAALVLQWLVSEVQLLSPEAQREALAIPMRILSKVGSRVAARAVRAVLSPSSSTRSTLLGPATPQPRLVQNGTAAAAAAAPAGSVPVGGSQAALPAAAVTTSTSTQAGTSSASSSSSGVVMAPVSAGGGQSGAMLQQPSNGSAAVAGSSSNGSGSSSSSNGQVVWRDAANGRSSGSSSPVEVSEQAAAVSVVTTPLPSDGKGGSKGGRMVTLKEV